MPNIFTSSAVCFVGAILVLGFIFLANAIRIVVREAHLAVGAGDAAGRITRTAGSGVWSGQHGKVDRRTRAQGDRRPGQRRAGGDG